VAFRVEPRVKGLYAAAEPGDSAAAAGGANNCVTDR
jgi:hypothetical protein